MRSKSATVTPFVVNRGAQCAMAEAPRSSMVPAFPAGGANECGDSRTRGASDVAGLRPLTGRVLGNPGPAEVQRRDLRVVLDGGGRAGKPYLAALHDHAVC